jgi:hypothetical protein
MDIQNLSESDKLVFDKYLLDKISEMYQRGVFFGFENKPVDPTSQLKQIAEFNEASERIKNTKANSFQTNANAYLICTISCVLLASIVIGVFAADGAGLTKVSLVTIILPSVLAVLGGNAYFINLILKNMNSEQLSQIQQLVIKSESSHKANATEASKQLTIAEQRMQLQNERRNSDMDKINTLYNAIMSQGKETRDILKAQNDSAVASLKAQNDSAVASLKAQNDSAVASLDTTILAGKEMSSREFSDLKSEIAKQDRKIDFIQKQIDSLITLPPQD